MKWIKFGTALAVNIVVLGMYCSAWAQTDTVIITEQDIAYDPEEITVHAGQMIRIENKDPFAHVSRVTIQKKDGSLGKIILKDHKEEPKTAFTFKLDQPGVYQLRCVIHDGMEAVIKVVK